MWGRAFGFVPLTVSEWQALENRLLKKKTETMSRTAAFSVTIVVYQQIWSTVRPCRRVAGSNRCLQFRHLALETTQPCIELATRVVPYHEPVLITLPLEDVCLQVVSQQYSSPVWFVAVTRSCCRVQPPAGSCSLQEPLTSRSALLFLHAGSCYRKWPPAACSRSRCMQTWSEAPAPRQVFNCLKSNIHTLDTILKSMVRIPAGCVKTALPAAMERGARPAPGTQSCCKDVRTLIVV